jgi:hypothetical protein
MPALAEANRRCLYRGMSVDFHRANSGELRPKACGSFEYMFKWGERGHVWGGGTTYGKSEANAVIRHQLNQEGFPTCGISTTPHIARAAIYARGKGGLSDGFVYEIDRERLTQFHIRELVVADFARDPSVPDDDEVILVTLNSEQLPAELVLRLIPVPPGSSGNREEGTSETLGA